MRSASTVIANLDLRTRTPRGRRAVLTGNALVLCIAVILVLLLGHFYGTRYYIAWPDETLFGDIAEEFVTHGVFGAPSFEGNGLGMSEKTYFMPPVYPLALAGWFRFFPHTVASARVLSNLLAGGCLVILFLLALSLRRNNLFAWIVVLAPAIDISFAFMFNWARPDILALSLSLLAVLVYFSGLADNGGVSLAKLLPAWAIASAAMLTHPISGAIGFLTIPIHLVFTSRRALRDIRVWIILGAVPICAVMLWGLYIVQDIEMFKAQFFGWQTVRKASRFTGIGSYLSVVVLTILNYGADGARLLGPGPVSTVIAAALWFKSFTETDARRPALLVLLLTLTSAFVVYYGKEMPYPPLRVPIFYMGLFFCIPTFLDMSSFFERTRTARGTSRFNWRLFVAALPLLVLVALLARSCLATSGILHEVRGSERSTAYNPAVLAEQIMAATAPNSSVGISVFPDCYDVLAHSGHFTAVRPLSFHNLSEQDLVRHVCGNDYLVITDSVLEPRIPGLLVDFRKPPWKPGAYREIAERYYRLAKEIVLPGGGTTRLYIRRAAETLIHPGKTGVPISEPPVSRTENR